MLSSVDQRLKSIPQFSSSNSNSTGDNMHDQLIQFEMLRRDFYQIKEAFKILQEFEDDVREPIKNLEHSLDDISDVVAEAPNDLSIADKVSALKKDAMKMKMKFPSLWRHKMSNTSPDVHRYSWPINRFDSGVAESHDLHISHKFLSSSVFTEFQKVFEELDTRLKLCCLSFAVLPANAVVKRRLLINWWVGERLVDPPATVEKTAEDIADEILTELKLKGFIEAVKERHKLVADRFKMQPLVHRVVIMLAQDQLLDYDSNGNPTVQSSRCNRVCLVKAEDGTSEQELAPDLYPEKLQTIFNVNEPFPDLRFEWSAKIRKVNIMEWFSKMKNLNVLYLGRWQSSDQHYMARQSALKNHIEVESTDFLKGLKNMKSLRLLSLQGISRINELPNSISKLTNLRILDLKACHNLEAIPDGIGSLKKLSRLDISGCYLLDDMPKGLASLSELQVLKGFLIGNLESDRDSCTLENLKGLKKLSKLSINTRSTAFPKEEELKALRKLEALRKLAIVWGVNRGDNRRQDSGAAQPKRALSRLNTQQPHPETQDQLPRNLEKLELQSFPDSFTPNWLMPGKLKSLKKLYIKGGKLKNLGQMQEGNDNWTVEILRLKYLDEFNMDQEELQISFPNLIFLENVKCPKLVSLSKIDNIQMLYDYG